MDYTEVSSDEIINKTVQALSGHNFLPLVVETKEQALDQIKSLIPQGASVMNGASKTLEQIGYVEYLKAGQHGWNNLHELILAEPDQEKQGLLRRQSTVSDFYLGSVHALTQTGSFLVASNTGSQLPHIVFNSPNLILVVGAQKIVPTVEEGFKRLKEHVVPLEDQRMKDAYGFGTTWSKTLIYNEEKRGSTRKINILIVKEPLGF